MTPIPEAGPHPIPLASPMGPTSVPMYTTAPSPTLTYGLASVPPPLSGASSGVSSGQTSHRPLSASSNRAAGNRAQVNSGAGSRKWPSIGRDEGRSWISQQWNSYNAAAAHAEMNASVIMEVSRAYKDATLAYFYGYYSEDEFSQRLEDIKDFKTEQCYINQQIIELLYEVDTSDPHYNIDFSILSLAKILEYNGYVPGVVRLRGAGPKHSIKPQRSVQKPHRGGAYNVNAGPALINKLSQLRNAPGEACRIKMLPDGRIRYYMLEKPADYPGRTRGSYNVIEWNPKTSQVRRWYESCDHAGRTNRVHPKIINGQEVNSPHYPPTAKELGL